VKCIFEAVSYNYLSQEIVRQFIRDSIREKHELSAYGGVVAFTKEVNGEHLRRLGLVGDDDINAWAHKHSSEVSDFNCNPH
jgi:hypothetical protein